MPQMADVTVKKADGTTDIVYNQVTPSGGDKSPAVWRCNADSTIPAHRTELRMTAGFNDKRTARRTEITGTAPYVVTDVNGKAVIAGRVNFNGDSVYADQSIPDAFVVEKITQYINFCSAPLIVACRTAGYAPV